MSLLAELPPVAIRMLSATDVVGILEVVIAVPTPVPVAYSPVVNGAVVLHPVISYISILLYVEVLSKVAVTTLSVTAVIFLEYQISHPLLVCDAEQIFVKVLDPLDRSAIPVTAPGPPDVSLVTMTTRRFPAS
jgi:hypothetical protein